MTVTQLKKVKMKESVPRRIINHRWWLFAGCMILVFIGSYFAAAKYTQIFWPPTRQMLSLTLFTCTGPFAAAVAQWVPLSEPVNWVFGIPCVMLLFLHPLRPRTLTAIITLIGFAVWMFMGIVMVYVGL